MVLFPSLVLIVFKKSLLSERLSFKYRWNPNNYTLLLNKKSRWVSSVIKFCKYLCEFSNLCAGYSKRIKYEF